MCTNRPLRPCNLYLLASDSEQYFLFLSIKTCCHKSYKKINHIRDCELAAGALKMNIWPKIFSEKLEKGPAPQCV